MESDSAQNFLSAASFWEPEWMPENSSWLEHAPFAFWLIGQLRPRSIVELGVHWGAAYMAFCQAIEKHGCETICTGVDTWNGHSDCGIFPTLNLYNQRKYGRFSKLIRSSFNDARPHFIDYTIDLLSLHEMRHFDSWLPAVSPRGVVIFHNTNLCKDQPGTGKLWEELRDKYPSFEFQHGRGLGVLAVGSDIPVALQKLFSLERNSTVAAEIRSTYRRLGKSLLQKSSGADESRLGQLQKFRDVQASLQKKYVEGLVAGEKAFRKQEHDLLKQNQSLRKIIKSAQDWQRQAWFTRAFHHWRAPSLPTIEIASSNKPDAPPATFKSDSTQKQLNTVFNAAYYLHINPAAAHSDLTPLEHYRTIGWKENIQPHPLFDAAWYLQQNPAASGQEPLQHYLEHGWKMGHSPHLFFDSQFYLENHPDLVTQGQEPLGHYLRAGWKKDPKTSPHGRFNWQREFPSLGALINTEEATAILGARFFSALETKAADQPAILLVTHESTRTGAPIILLNLAKKLRHKYFIIVVDFCEHALKSEFEQASDYYVGFGTRTQPRIMGLSLHLLVLQSRCPIYFALVNTLACTKILPLLARHNVPTVHLVHEFAESWRPRFSFRDAVFRAGKMVFPAQVVLDSARRACPELKTSQVTLLQQGLCLTPTDNNSIERETIPQAIRPSGWEDATIILGLGCVEYRKGVDLFFLCAHQLIQRNPGRKIRFVWIGAGFVSEQPNHFCVYLEDQLRKTSIDGSMVILDEITDVAVAYAEANIVFVSSRQDPFPLVAQEAMHHALPVICFSGATGTADVLAAEPITRECVIPYLDIEAACSELQRLIEDPALRTSIGLKCRQMADTLFDFDTYATQIEKLALERVELMHEQSLQVEKIDRSGVFDLDYFRSPILPEIWTDPGQWYVLAWSKGMNRRKPFPGFHPGIYAERNQIPAGDPLVHFLQSGQPSGPWLTRRISPLLEKIATPLDCKVALHIHLFYADMADEISRRLHRNQTLVDLFISVPDQETAELARLKFAACANRMEVALVPNRGRDIGAFLKIFTKEIARDYEIVGHLHTKKSLHSTKLSKIALWKEFLFENHLGGREAMMDAILGAMMEDPQIGIVFPDDPNALGWGKNFPSANELLARMGLPPVVYQEINFPAGNFFWARTAALQKLLDLDFQWEDFPMEPVPMDGTILHAIERLLPLISESPGFHTAITAVPGFTR